MKPPRGLTQEEAEAWARVAATVRPLDQRRRTPQKASAPDKPATAPPAAPSAPAKPPRPAPPPRRGGEEGLDSHWDRRFARGTVEPDFTLDLHGHTLDSAYERLHDGIAQARQMGARVVLVIAGKPRAVDPADRGARRGAIRAKLLDWLAAGPHADAIRAVRKAHRRHGGEGALYLILRRGA